jgi:hypothetical protein
MRIEIPNYDGRGWDEYALPSETIDLPRTQGLPPWIKQWIGLDPDEITRMLAMEWARVRYPEVASFRDVVLKFRPFALARDDQRSYLALERGSEEFDRGTVYIEAPLAPADLERCLALHNLTGDDLMRDFYTNFHGLRDRPLYSGNFERPEEWTSLRGIGWDEMDFTADYRSTSERWLDALILYTTLTGDMVLRNAEGRIAWVLREENRVVPLVRSFAEFLKICTESYDRRSCLDSYSLDDLGLGAMDDSIE